MKGKAVKYYHLTPKAYRYMEALDLFEKKMEELNKISDEEILERAKEENVDSL